MSYFDKKYPGNDSLLSKSGDLMVAQYSGGFVVSSKPTDGASPLDKREADLRAALGQHGVIELLDEISDLRSKVEQVAPAFKAACRKVEELQAGLVPHPLKASIVPLDNNGFPISTPPTPMV